MFNSRQTPVVLMSIYCLKISFGKLDFDGYILIWSHRMEWQYIFFHSVHISQVLAEPFM